MTQKITNKNDRARSLVRGMLWAGVWLLVGIAMPWGSQAAELGPITDDNVAQRAAVATTAQEHEALAAYFRAESAAFGEKVKVHEAMLDTWQKTTAGRPLENMREHCRSAMRSLGKLQRDYEAYAKEQESLAKAAK